MFIYIRSRAGKEKTDFKTEYVYSNIQKYNKFTRRIFYKNEEVKMR